MLAILLAGALPSIHPALGEEGEDLMQGLSEGAEGHMREELGVNDTTTPQIQKLLLDLDSFQPIPMKLVESNDLTATFPNRFQTALHFGMIVADGFVIVINERPQSIQNIGRALIRQARALGVGDSLTKRAASLIDLGQKGDWMRLREELIKTQSDVEGAMMNLHDEEMAHLISFGGWLRGFQFAVNATADKYTPQRAAGLKRLDVISYFIDRLDTLNPRLKQTPLVALLLSRLKTIYSIESKAGERPPSQSEVNEMRDLANEMVAAALSKTDDNGKLLDVVE
ncbi:MAG: hypothetical protein PHC88_03200 [Terrimicrobiaceae bacterium]|nr:hypothetical protein [Terrimicrobiaceae bacterium]